MSSPSPAPSSDHKETDEETRSSPEPAREPMEKCKESTLDDDTPPPSSDPSSSTPSTTATPASFSAGAWQAIFSPQHSVYYFYNSSTGETTWVNPLQPSSADPAIGAQDTADTQANGTDENVDYDSNSVEARAIAVGIDPALAYLDPSLAGPSTLAHTGSFTAKFNARTGAFSAPDARAPSHLSEYERMKRMSEFYFDMGAWEKDVEQRHAEEKEAGGKKRKKPTKKDLERFKEQKRLKKIAKTAWLRT